MDIEYTRGSQVSWGYALVESHVTDGCTFSYNITGYAANNSLTYTTLFSFYLITFQRVVRNKLPIGRYEIYSTF